MSNMVVRTNVMALNSHRNLGMVGVQQRNASARLSSGFRINSAADDAAGLGISENMRAQIRGLDQASRNAQDGISLIQTAEGAMDTLSQMVIRIRTLVIQASNDTNRDVDRSRIQDEINQLIEEIDGVAERTQFNGMTLLDGSLGATSGGVNNLGLFAGADTAQAMALLHATDGLTGEFGVVGSAALNTAIQEAVGQMAGVRLNGAMTVTAASNGIIRTINNSLANELGIGVGGPATLDAWIKEATGDATATAISLLSGVGVDRNGGFTVPAAQEQHRDVITRIFNALNAADISAFITVDSRDNTNFFQGGNLTSGQDLTAVTAANLGNGVLSANERTATAWNSFADSIGMAIAGVLGATTIQSWGNAAMNRGDFVIGELSTWQGVAATATGVPITTNDITLQHILNYTGDNSFLLQARNELREAINGVSRDTFLDGIIMAGGAGGGGLWFHIGANEDQGVTLNIARMASDVLGIPGERLGDGNGGSNVDVTDGTGEIIQSRYFDRMDGALNHINQQRSLLGAMQNRLEFTIQNLDVASENLSAAESRIRDADMAIEMMRLTQANVLQQAATAMLAQANQAPQSILQLLG